MLKFKNQLYHLRLVDKDTEVYDYGYLSWEDVQKFVDAIGVSVDHYPLEVVSYVGDLEQHAGKFIAKRVSGVKPRQKPFEYYVTFSSLEDNKLVNTYASCLSVDCVADKEGLVDVCVAEGKLHSATIERKITGDLVDLEKFQELMKKKWLDIREIEWNTKQDCEARLLVAFDLSLKQAGK